MRAKESMRELKFVAERKTAEMNYWLNKLSGELTGTGFPYDWGGSDEKRVNNEMGESRVDFKIEGELYDRIMKMCRGSDVRLYVVMVTGVVLLLNRYTSVRDIVVGAPIFKQEVKGTLINKVLALRNRLDNGKTGKELVLQVGMTVFEAIENQNYPIEEIMNKLGKAEESGGTLFDVAVMLENIHEKEYLRGYPTEVTFSFCRTEGAVEGRLEYKTALYEETAVRRRVAHFKMILETLIYNIDTPLAELEMLSGEEREKLIRRFNDNRAEFSSDRTICSLFEEHAKRTPEREALVYNEQRITYGELNERVERLALYLRQRGVGKDHTVGILQERSPRMVESILAVWRAGGAYIPLDVENPATRNAGILQDSASGVLITGAAEIDPGIAERYEGLIIPLETFDQNETANEEGRPGERDIDMNGLAYVIYTSGSTGKPKGAMIEHVGMMNHIGIKVNDLQITAESVVVQNASHTFDISVWQFFAALTEGGKTVIIPREEVLQVDAVVERLIREGVTIFEVVPSYLSILMESDSMRDTPPLPDLEYLLVTGEEVKPHQVRQWFEKYPGIKMVNAYGPTEASDDITHHIMDRAPEGDRVPIGRPLQNLTIYIVDENMKLVPIGVKGEICVSGVGVGRGYLNAVEQTHEVYKEDMYTETPGVRLYKTGDLGSWRPDGTIDYFGRKDHQVKVRGYRIELSEIESRLIKHPSVKEAVVQVREKDGGEKYLCAYITPGKTTGQPVDEKELKTYFLEHLPGYMMPETIVQLEKFPLSPNGKLDRKALPEPDRNRQSEMKYIPAETLEKLAEELDIAAITAKERESLAAISKRTGRKVYPLSHSQKMFYYIEKTYQDTSCENIGFYIEYNREEKEGEINEGAEAFTGFGEPDRQRLETAIREVIEANENYRTRIVELDEEGYIGPAQYFPANMANKENETITVDYHDFSADESGEAAQRWMREKTDRPMAFIDGPLTEAAIIKQGEKRYGYYLKFHQVVIDGSTLAQMFDEIDGHYREQEKGNRPQPRLRPPYRQFVADEGDYLQSPQAKEDREYWLDYLQPLPAEIDLSPVRNEKQTPGAESGSYTGQIDDDIRRKMHEYREENRASLFRQVMAALSIYIGRVTGRREFIIGTVNHGRHTEDHHKIMGLFLKFVPIKIKIDEDVDYRGLVKQVGENISIILKNHVRYPGDRLAADIKKITGKDTGHFWNITLIGHPDKEKKDYRIEKIPTTAAGVPLTVHVNINNKDIDGQLEVLWLYRTDQYSGDDIRRLHRDLAGVLRTALENPGMKLAELETLIPGEKKENRAQQEKAAGGDREPIDIGEIEKSLTAHQEIEEAAVILKEDNRDAGEGEPRQRPVAYLTMHRPRPESEIRAYLAEQHPQQTIPLEIVRLERMPRTAGKKVDRRLLQAVDHREQGAKVEHEKPRTPGEELLVEIWSRLLGRETVGVDENFFMIGGDSVKTIQIAARINKAGYKVRVQDIFQNPTIAALAPLLKKADRTQTAAQAAVGTIPLTPIQERFFENIGETRHHNNQAVMLYSRQGFEEEAIKEVVRELQQHHDALRMTYKEEAGTVVQTCHGEDYPQSVQVIDYRGQKRGAEEIKEMMENEADRVQESIDLEKGPLMKTAIFRHDDGDRLLIVIHHLVTDGISWRILFEDIDALQEQRRKKIPYQLPPKSDSYKSWAETLRRYADSETFLKEKDYWAKLEAEADTVPTIEKDIETEDNYVRDVESTTVHLTEEQTETLLTGANHAFNTQINDLLLVSLGLGIRKTMKHDRVLIALEGHGRDALEEYGNVDISRTVGWFTTVYPVILEVGGDGDISGPVISVKETLRRIPGKGMGYSVLKYLSSESHRPEYKLKPRISFNYLGQFDADMERATFEIAPESAGKNVSPAAKRNYELEVTGMIAGKKLHLSITYSKRQYKAATVEALMNNTRGELIRVVENCAAREERRQTPSDLFYKGVTVEELDGIARRYPVEDVLTLSPMQEGFYYVAQSGEHTSAYFQQMAYRLKGEMDIRNVEKSLNGLMRRYEILRAAYMHEGLHRPLQIILKERNVDFYYEDIRGAGDIDERAAIARAFRAKDRRRSFDLAKDVLMRVSLFRLDDEEYEFIWSFHHILLDGWCGAILISDFMKIYTGYRAGRRPVLPPVIPYRTYLRWIEERDTEKLRDYWKKYLEGYDEIASVSVLQTTAAGSETDEYKLEEHVFMLDEEKNNALIQYARRNKVTVNTVMQTVWGIVIGKYNDKKDVVFAAVVSGRPPEIKDVESIVGIFINTVPVRVKYNDDIRFDQLLREIQERTILSEPYHHYPLSAIQAQSALKQNLVDYVVAFENFPLGEQVKSIIDKGKEENVEMNLELSDMETFGQVNYDFCLVFLPGKDHLKVRMVYNGNRYERRALEKLATHMQEVLDTVIEEESITIGEINLTHRLSVGTSSFSRDEYTGFGI